jgi:D-lyxose ketol-isomerase
VGDHGDTLKLTMRQGGRALQDSANDMRRSDSSKMRLPFQNSRASTYHPLPFGALGEGERKGSEYDKTRDNMLGCDATDFGSGDFLRLGLLLFTLRNGNQQLPQIHQNLCREGAHCGRETGDVLSSPSIEAKESADTPVVMYEDGRRYEVPAGTMIRLMPGEGITLKTSVYHRFWGEEKTGKDLLGEVSQVNDD